MIKINKQFSASLIISLLAGIIIILANWQNNFALNNNKGTDNETILQTKLILSAIGTEKKGESAISCEGEIYNIYPTLDGIKNKQFAELLHNIKKLVIKETDDRAPNNPFENELYEYISDESKGKFISYGYIDFQTRIDGEKLAWSPVTLLPTNGKFLMMIIANWERDLEEPPSTGYFLCTFTLAGEMQSITHIYGHEEYYKNKQNTDILTGIWGRAYCLNTNRPVVRKAILWDEYDNRGGFIGGTLEIKEINYSISENGIIHAANEKVIFPKTHVQWKDRDGKSFSEESDTIRKMLGEIE